MTTIYTYIYTTVQVGEIHARSEISDEIAGHEPGQWSWVKSLMMLTSSCSLLEAWGLLLMSWSPFSTARQAAEILVKLMKTRNPHVASCFTKSDHQVDENCFEFNACVYIKPEPLSASPQAYDAARNNCNHFTDRASLYLAWILSGFEVVEFPCDQELLKFSRCLYEKVEESRALIIGLDEYIESFRRRSAAICFLLIGESFSS